jgi:hypothetical protein
MTMLSDCPTERALELLNPTLSLAPVHAALEHGWRIRYRPAGVFVARRWAGIGLGDSERDIYVLEGQIVLSGWLAWAVPGGPPATAAPTPMPP